jgi:hypothetical protein
MAERQSSAHAARARLARSIGALVVGEPQATEERETALRPISGGDMAQNIRAPIEGTAFRRPQWTRFGVSWPNPFLMAMSPQQTDGDLRTPHFTPGVEIVSGANVIIQVLLREWVTDARGFYTGASLAVGAWLPEAPKRVNFSGFLHLSFSGYAGPSEDDSQG